MHDHGGKSEVRADKKIALDKALEYGNTREERES